MSRASHRKSRNDCNYRPQPLDHTPPAQLGNTSCLHVEQLACQHHQHHPAQHPRHHPRQIQRRANVHGEAENNSRLNGDKDIKLSTYRFMYI